MKTDNKIIQYQKGLQPIALLCVLLILLTSHPVMLAAVMVRSVSTPPTAAVSTEQQVPLEASPTNAPIVWKYDTSLAVDTNLLPILALQDAMLAIGSVSGVVLEDDFSLRYTAWDSSKFKEVCEAMAKVDTNIIVSVDGTDLIITFPEAIAESLKNALDGNTISLGKIDRGPGPGQNLFWCVVVLVGLGAGAYYGMKYLCKQAGLIPTNVPPPPPTNPPPPPPPTNKPPTWTNTPGGPVTITGTGGFKMYSLVSEASVMPPEVHAALMAGTSPSNPLFKTETEGPDGITFHGVASMDARDFNVRYGPGYNDPVGNAYSNCLRYVVQAGHTLANGTTNWQTRMTMYVWVNDAHTCFSIYDVNKVLRENVVVSRNSLGNGPPVVIGSFDYVITHWYNPNTQGFFRTWSGVPETVP